MLETGQASATTYAARWVFDREKGELKLYWLDAGSPECAFAFVQWNAERNCWGSQRCYGGPDSEMWDVGMSSTLEAALLRVELRTFIEGRTIRDDTPEAVLIAEALAAEGRERDRERQGRRLVEGGAE
jgi:hypothetical protein